MTLNETFQTEQDYLNYVRTMCLFSHLSAYNGGCHLWKKEDIKFINNLDKTNFKDKNPELYKKSVEVYLAAEESYGKLLSEWKYLYSDLEDSFIEDFGLVLDIGDEDGNSYVCEMLDKDFSKMKRNENYPKSFPVIVIGSAIDKDISIEMIYPEDFNKKSVSPDFAWLEENIRNFWEKGEGHMWGE